MRALLAAAILSLCGATAARADESSDEVRVVYKKGVDAYNLAKYGDALELFRHAYELKSDPSLLFNIAQCERQLAHYARAVNFYRTYLRESSPRLSPETVAQVERLMKAASEALVVQQTAAQAPSPAPTVAPLAVVAAAPPRRRWYTSRAGWTLAGLGLVGVVAGGALIAVAAANGTRATSAMLFADAERYHDDDITLQQAGWPTLGVGAAALVSAGITFGVEGRR